MGAGMRIGCCGFAVVRVGFGASMIGSFSSESSGAATRKASTSFSSLVSSSSFWRKTSYTFFMREHLFVRTWDYAQSMFPSAICQGKRQTRAWMVIELGQQNRLSNCPQTMSSKYHDRDQDAQNQDNNCEH